MCCSGSFCVYVPVLFCYVRLCSVLCFHASVSVAVSFVLRDVLLCSVLFWAVSHYGYVLYVVVISCCAMF